jgi:hypothetical protein
LNGRRGLLADGAAAAKGNGKGGAATGPTNSYVLVSTLPAKYHVPGMLSPSAAPTEEAESAYIGLYTFVISLIYLKGGMLPEAALDRYLRRTNADQTTPVDRTEKLLQRMVKDGYVNKVKDNSSGEEKVDYIVGPRGKVEVGEDGVAQFIKNVWGTDDAADLHMQIERSLTLVPKPGRARTATPKPVRKPKRSSNARRPNDNEEGGSEDDDSDDDDDDGMDDSAD